MHSPIKSCLLFVYCLEYSNIGIINEHLAYNKTNTSGARNAEALLNVGCICKERGGGKGSKSTYVHSDGLFTHI